MLLKKQEGFAMHDGTFSLSEKDGMFDHNLRSFCVWRWGFIGKERRDLRPFEVYVLLESNNYRDVRDVLDVFVRLFLKYSLLLQKMCTFIIALYNDLKWRSKIDCIIMEVGHFFNLWKSGVVNMTSTKNKLMS
jgi:hypothetical protein